MIIAAATLSVATMVAPAANAAMPAQPSPVSQVETSQNTTSNALADGETHEDTSNTSTQQLQSKTTTPSAADHQGNQDQNNKSENNQTKNSQSSQNVASQDAQNPNSKSEDTQSQSVNPQPAADHAPKTSGNVPAPEDDDEGTVIVSAWNRDHDESHPVQGQMTAKVGEQVDLEKLIEQAANQESFVGAHPSFEENGQTYYYFNSGWNSEPDGSGTTLLSAYGFTDNYTMQPGEHHFYMIWHKYEIKFYGDSGNGVYNASPSTGTDTLGGKVTLQKPQFNLHWSDWNFKGWSTSPDGSGTFIKAGEQFTMPDKIEDYQLDPIIDGVNRLSIILYGQWQKTATVSFETGEGGTPIDDLNVDLGEYIATMPQDPTRDGYKFAGWRVDGEPFSQWTRLHDDITLVASWTPIASFDAATGNSDDDPDDILANFLQQVKLPEAPTKTFNASTPAATTYRQRFLGWQAEGDDAVHQAGKTVDLKTPAQYTARYAKYQLNIVPGDDATGAAKKVADLGGDLQDTFDKLPEAPASYTYEKHHFVGWKIAGDSHLYKAGDSFTAIDSMPLEAVTEATRSGEPYAAIILTAQWEKDASDPAPSGGTDDQPSDGSNSSDGSVNSDSSDNSDGSNDSDDTNDSNDSDSSNNADNPDDSDNADDTSDADNSNQLVESTDENKSNDSDKLSDTSDSKDNQKTDGKKTGSAAQQNGTLAVTGAQAVAVALAAVVLLAFGIVIAVAKRRRD